MIRDPFDIHRKNRFQATAFRAAQSIRDTAAQVGASALDMSFSIPNKTAQLWGSASRPRGQSLGVCPRGAEAAGIINGVQGKVAGFFDQEGLPMYKDKPYAYAPSMRRRPWWRRKRILSSIVLGVLTLLYLLGFIGLGHERKTTSAWSWLGLVPEKGSANWDERRQHVVEAFELSWDAYERYAWGM